MSYTKEQLEKLPKWAQSEIRTLEMVKNSLEQRIMQFSGAAETNTYICNGLSKMPIQNNARIDFYTDDKKLNKASIYVREDGTIDVNTDSRMGKTMVIRPRASNSFYIYFV